MYLWIVMKDLFASSVSMPTLNIEAVDTCGWRAPTYAGGHGTVGARTGMRTPRKPSPQFGQP